MKPWLPNFMQALSEASCELKWPSFRVKQIHHAREISLARNWEEITTLSKTDRDYLVANVSFDTLTIERVETSADSSAIKWLLKTADGETLEAVLLLHTSGKKKWGTVCLSSQIGCAMKCKFCATGQMGLTRDLSTDEILDQFLIAKREATKRGIVSNLNVVFMGMGEPLLNLDNVSTAIRTLTDAKRYGLASSRVTISTSGVLPGLVALREMKLGIGLALSLHAPTDDLRSELMPINTSHPLIDVMAELKNWEREGTETLIEYVLIAEQNDSPEQADQLVELLKGRKVKINLIPLNPVAGSDLERPSGNRMHTFFDILAGAGLIVTLRHTKGDDIKAACGQLKTKQ